MEQKIGLQLASIRSEMEKDFNGSLEKVKAAGYDFVEFAGYGGYDASALKSELNRIGLEPYSTHISMKQSDEQFDKEIAYAVELGVAYVIGTGYPIRTASDCARISESLTKAGMALKPYGIKIGYHHGPTAFQKFNEQYALNLIIQNNDGVHVTVEVDTCWVQYADVDPVWLIDSLKDAVGPLHFKDINAKYKELQKNEVSVEVGLGIIDFPSIIAVARKNDILDRGIIVEQETYTRDMFESIKISCDNIRKMLCIIN